MGAMPEWSFVKRWVGLKQYCRIPVKIFANDDQVGTTKPLKDGQ